MSAPSTTRLLRQSIRHASRTLFRPSPQQQVRRSINTQSLRQTPLKSVSTSHPRFLSTSHSTRAGLMPDTEDPQPPSQEAARTETATQPTEISDDEYHQLADEYLDAVNEKVEALQEGREDVDIDYSQGVMTISFPPNGTYVLNKQPPNKQIWLSSPLNGPKRYDWVMQGEGMNQKEGGGRGEWVYLRDGSTLSSLLQKELGITVDHHEEDLETVSTEPKE